MKYVLVDVMVDRLSCISDVATLGISVSQTRIITAATSIKQLRVYDTNEEELYISENY